MISRHVIIAVVICSLLGMTCAAPPSIRSPSFLSPSSSSPSFPSFSFPSPSHPSPSSSALPSFNFPSPSRDRPSPSAPDLPSPSISSSGSSSSSSSQPNLPDLDPQQAISTLSSMSQTLQPSFANGLNMITSSLSQIAPTQQQVLNQPSTEDSAVDLPSTSATVTASSPVTSTSATPVRGQSPFPFQPTNFVNPLDNPTHRVPQPPAASCTNTDFQCQAYKQCYPCYANTGLSQCGTCLNLMKCQHANCQLKEMCNLCHVASSMAVCSMAEPYCPL